MSDGILKLDNKEQVEKLRKFLEESKTPWTLLMLDCLTDFDGEWDFDKDGSLGVIEVKREIK